MKPPSTLQPLSPTGRNRDSDYVVTDSTDCGFDLFAIFDFVFNFVFNLYLLISVLWSCYNFAQCNSYITSMYPLV